jgi:hypothetical protein
MSSVLLIKGSSQSAFSFAQSIHSLSAEKLPILKINLPVGVKIEDSYLNIDRIRLCASLKYISMSN